VNGLFDEVENEIFYCYVIEVSDYTCVHIDE
jgi:hypothetical protein